MLAASADVLTPTQRINTIAKVFRYFKNPDKETVLTPWRVVNMHMSDIMGGWCFYDEKFEKMLEEPRFVDRGKVTADTFNNPDAEILEINSKSGLYPLYVAYSIYRAKLKARTESDLTRDEQQALWRETIQNNVFVICKTPMAKFITQRTLAGYSQVGINAHYFDDLVNMLRNKPDQFRKKVVRGNYWGKEVREMEFDAIVGNPPYQVMDGGQKASATPLYHFFVEQGKTIAPEYISMIMPARWFSGGRGLDAFRDSMLNDDRLEKIVDYTDANVCFPGVDIAGGICYFLWHRNYHGKCEFTNIHQGQANTLSRDLNDTTPFVRYNNALSITSKVNSFSELVYSSRVSSQKPFGLRTYVKPESKGELMLRYSGGIGPYPRSKVDTGIEWIGKWKVVMSYLTYDHAGLPDKDGKRRIFSIIEILPPNTICTETYIVVDAFDSEQEAINLLQYLRTSFVRL